MVFSVYIKNLALKMLAVLVSLLVLASFVNSYITGFEVEVYECFSSGQSQTVSALPKFKDIINDIFNKKEENIVKPNISVYLGGYPLGFTLNCDGVMVVAIGEVQTIDKIEKPLENKDVRVGDVIKEIEGQKITSALDMQEKLNECALKNQDVRILVDRQGSSHQEIVTPALEFSTSCYRLGVWIRDNSAGVGTLTYIRQDNHRFGALGHPVTDIDTAKAFPISAGNIYKCSIVGYNKSLRGNPGELRGLFLRSGEEAGVLDNNNDYGVYGTVKQEYIDKNIDSKLVQVGFRDIVKTGKAKMVCTIDGTKPKEYDIEIIKLSYQSTSGNKSMVIKVTDQELINQTGGIVQGMSGSPILQDGKLVGAVTHVFVSDPTKGFGVYIDWMIDN